MTYMKKLVGERCYLSPVSTEDAQKVARWSNDMEVSIHTGDASDMITIEKQRDYLEYMNSGGYGFIIITKEENEPIGICRLKNLDLINRKAELGIFIGEKTCWNTGIGTEATKLVLDYGFNILNLRNIMLEVFSFNERAIKAYQRCGFKEIGRRRQSILLGGKAYDEIYMDILSEEFKDSTISPLIKDK